MPDADLTTFDAPRFAKWLRKWKDAERLEWKEIAERSGLHLSTVLQLARGHPQRYRAVKGQREVNPGIVTIARLAHGLDLEFGYVASKGGIFGGGADRWEHFSEAERTLIEHALSVPTLALTVGGAWEDQRQRLVQELRQHDHHQEEVTA